MELFQIDDDGRLFVSAAIQRWNVAAARGVDVVIDLEGGLDLCIPTQANHCLYVYFPFDDDDRVAAEPDEAAGDRATRGGARARRPHRADSLQRRFQPVGP